MQFLIISYMYILFSFYLTKYADGHGNNTAVASFLKANSQKKKKTLKSYTSNIKKKNKQNPHWILIQTTVYIRIFKSFSPLFSFNYKFYLTLDIEKNTLKNI